MERIYYVGNTSGQISISVNTGTAATSYTIANQLLAGGQKVFKAESDKNANGVIMTTDIGTGVDLESSELVIQTIADFSALPADVINVINNDSHALKANLMIEYKFSGGTTGVQKYDWDYDDYIISSNGTIAVVTKKICLKE